MSIHSVRRFPLIALFLFAAIAFCLPYQASAQTEIDTVTSLPGIEIETSVDKAEIYIGDLIKYTVTIKYDSTYELVPPPLGANLGAFDVKDYESDKESRLEDGRKQSENIFVLSTFTTGDYIIPPVPILFTLPDGARKALLSEAVPIKVLSLLTNVGDSVDVRPLKEPYQFARDYTLYYIWGGIVAFVLILAALFIWWRIRKRRMVGEPIDLRPPWEIAFEQLALLQQKKLPDEERYKEYYIELTEILRTYLGRMYNVNVLDMTTYEFETAFADISLPNGQYERTISFFKSADLIKFAKQTPESSAPGTDLELVHECIDKVRADFQHQEEIQKADRQLVKTTTESDSEASDV